jgi:hypothetical protein
MWLVFLQAPVLINIDSKDMLIETSACDYLPLVGHSFKDKCIWKCLCLQFSQLTYEEFEGAIKIRLIEEEQKLFPLVCHSFVVVDSTWFIYNF